MARNHADHTPAAVMVLDTETRRTPTPAGEDQTLRLWCARWVRRRAQSGYQPADESHWGTDAAQLAALIDAKTRGNQHLWCYAHNLGYDLQSSALLGHLAAIGWTISAVSSVSRYLWLTMARHTDRCPKNLAKAPSPVKAAAKCRCVTVHFADTVHMWPMKLEAMGDLLGTPKLPMPADDADESEWVRYCMRDVDVAMCALLETMAFWDERKLGRWAITSAACGSNALRHQFGQQRPVLFDDPEGSEWDRSAIYGGRRQCWKHGDLPPGRYAELDFQAAYATVGANWPLPFKRGAWFDGLANDDKRVDHPMISCIAECEVETDVPRFPVRVDGAVDYPVGRFTTTLAGPDIAWARETGCLRRIGRGQWHLLGTGYQPFFKRVLDWGRPGQNELPPIVAAAWKHFGRTVIGKFAQRGYKTRNTGMLSTETLLYEREASRDDGINSALIHYGGYIWEVTEDGDGNNAYPAVTAFVESRTRVALGKAAEAIGQAAMVLCDTDGLWVNAGALEAGRTGDIGFDLADNDRRIRIDLLIDVLNVRLAPFILREKAVSERIRIAGPQIYQAGTVSKASGRPRALSRQGDDTWSGQTFPSFAWQQQHSQPGTFKTRLESWQWPATRIRGWCLADGRVLPLQVLEWPDGGRYIVPWRQDGASAYPVPLAPVQHPALDGLWSADDTRGEVTSGRQGTGHQDRPAAPGASGTAGSGHATAPAQSQLSDLSANIAGRRNPLPAGSGHRNGHKAGVTPSAQPP